MATARSKAVALANVCLVEDCRCIAVGTALAAMLGCETPAYTTAVPTLTFPTTTPRVEQSSSASTAWIVHSSNNIQLGSSKVLMHPCK